MIIGFDIDDTIADTYKIFFAYVQKFIIEELERELVVKDNGKIIHSYHYAEINNISEEENNHFLKKYLKKIFEEVEPKVFAKEYIKKLHNEGHTIVLITSRWKENEEITKWWLEKNEIIYDKLIMHCENKESSIKDNNIEIFIDDNLEYCKQALKNGVKTFLMDTRPNRNLNVDEIKRIYSYPHLYKELMKEFIKNNEKERKK